MRLPRLRLPRLLLAGLLLAAMTHLPLADPPVGTDGLSLVNPGFETVGPGGRPGGWTAAGEPAPQAVIARDTAVRRTGGASLRLHCPQPGMVTMRSEPLALQVGHLYRLSGWLRAEAARTDPADSYPTPVPAAVTMTSFPFTNHSPAVGGTRDWTEVAMFFIATAPRDHVQVHLGLNGPATGTVWFDDLRVDKVEDIHRLIPAETVRWFGPAYRYDDQGWIFVHIEGGAYERGYQLGTLLWEEIAAYARKLAVRQNAANPDAGWRELRFQTQAITWPRFEPEYQTEMKGIADGAARAGAKVAGRPIDRIDVGVLNSVIDLGQMQDAVNVTPDATTGLNFLRTEYELRLSHERHKCSAFAATGSATADGGVVFGQIFMWNGYTGFHWDVICDVQPDQGHRFVHHTFPGGIHSGADFYINAAGLVIGETTVAQTPYNPDGTPQSNRIRKAIQYADTIEDVVRIMTDRNNGQYTNEWPYADVKTGEVGIFLLGTHTHRLWRSTTGDFPGGLTDFYWCNNNNKNLETRLEYVAHPEGAPHDLMFRPWNRDVAFNRFFQAHQGRIDIPAAVRLWASSPTNRPHACDGKLTTSDMARELVFLAHYGKVTLREKFVGGRFIASLPEAAPHLSLGYSTPSPLFVTPKLQQARPAPGPSQPAPPALDLGAVADTYRLDHRALWRGTVIPAGTAEGWFVSGSAAYWRMLRGVSDQPAEAAPALDRQLTDLNSRLVYLVGQEGDLAPSEAGERYDRYGHYDIPRLKGTYALHQLRLKLGNASFFEVMDKTHAAFANRRATSAELVAGLEAAAGEPLADFLAQWLDRAGWPEPVLEAELTPEPEGGWRVRLTVQQAEPAWEVYGHVDLIAGHRRHRHPVRLAGPRTELELTCAERPVRVLFNTGADFPVGRSYPHTLSNFFDEFDRTLIVYGTSRQIEANHTLARRWRETLADAYTEILLPIRKDCEMDEADLARHDLMVLGHPTDNGVMGRLLERLPADLDLSVDRNLFRFLGQVYARPDDGLVLAVPNPWNGERVAYLFLSNSALQLHRMTGAWNRNVPAWAVFRGDRVEASGHLPEPGLIVTLPNE